MPAVVRVKRRIDEEPLSAFVLNGKKRRLEDGAAGRGGDELLSELGATGGAEEISTILKFAGTLSKQDNNATTRLARLTKDAAKELVQQKSQRKPADHTERARQEMRQSLHEQRFRVVNCLRTTLAAADGDDEAAGNDAAGAINASKAITIVDIEKQTATSAVTAAADDAAAATAAAAATSTTIAPPELIQPTDSDTGFVYDLYLPENEQQAAYVDQMDDNYLSVRVFDDLVYEDRFNEDDDDDDNDSEDSNQENHIGNEYPDEDDEFASNVDDDEEFEYARELRQGVEKFVLDDDEEDEEAAGCDESSSDDDGCNAPFQDPYVHIVEAEEGFVDDIDVCDVDRYGMAYARYKARILKKSKGDAAHDNENSDSGNERYHSASENEEFLD